MQRNQINLYSKIIGDYRARLKASLESFFFFSTDKSAVRRCRDANATEKSRTALNSNKIMAQTKAL